MKYMYDNAKVGSWMQVNAVIKMINCNLYMNDFFLDSSLWLLYSKLLNVSNTRQKN